MKVEEMRTLLDLMHIEELNVREAGDAEYTTGDDTLSNFKEVGALLGLDPEVVLMVYASKHFFGICNYARGKKSQREDVRGRILDLRMYLALLRGLVEEREANERRIDT